MSDLVDLDQLTQQAARLVEAARAAGADAADAVAVRSVNQVASVLKGKVEKIEHAENDDFGLRVFVGDRNATISATLGSDVEALAARAVAMARAAPSDRFAGLADGALLATSWPDMDLLDETPVSAADLAERSGGHGSRGRHQYHRRQRLLGARRHGSGHLRRIFGRL